MINSHVWVANPNFPVLFCKQNNTAVTYLMMDYLHLALLSPCVVVVVKKKMNDGFIEPPKCATL